MGEKETKDKMKPVGFECGHRSGNSKSFDLKSQTAKPEQRQSPCHDHAIIDDSSHHSVRFSTQKDDVLTYPKPSIEDLPDLFYDDDEIAQFRYDAFCEECGFDADDFH